MNQFLLEIKQDCEILLNRAVLGKTLSCFGIDGLGQYGKCDFAQHYKVIAIEVNADGVADGDEINATMILHLDGYTESQYGSLNTDQNFRISLNQHLAPLFIDKSHADSCWDWDMSVSLPGAVVLDLDVYKLLQFA
jgi:hypothetical protein